jgi:hypothetical protein
MKANDALLDYLFDGQAQARALRPALQNWLDASRRYAAFVSANRDKIRKKIRLMHNSATAADLRWELEAAFLLHADKRFTLDYEPYARGQPFGPDFRVTYTTSFAFNVEVTRVRIATSDANSGDGKSGEARRLVETVGNKLYQLLPNAPNVVAIAAPDVTTSGANFAAEMAILRRRAEQRDTTMIRLGFGSASDFLRAYERLSLVIVRGYALEGEGAPAGAFLWRNPAARQPVPAKAITVLRNCFSILEVG